MAGSSRHPGRGTDGFVANFVRRILSFDSQALNATKAILNQSGLPHQVALHHRDLRRALRSPAALQKMTKSLRTRPWERRRSSNSTSVARSRTCRQADWQ